MVTVKKKFYSIGQGSFYSEQIFFNKEVKTIVYDCGSANEERLEKEINQSGLSTIDFLIISHFHNDHINGIEKLKRICTIKNVVIPKIDAIDVAFYLGSGNTIEEILLNQNNFWGQTKIITVDSEGEPTPFEDTANLPNNISHNTNIPVLILKNSKIWELRFYVDKKVFINFTTEQLSLINEISTITDYVANKDQLIEAYNSLSHRNLNLTSMSMMSSLNPIHWYEPYDFPVSVLNGDIILNSEEKIRLYTDHFFEFSCLVKEFQIPHHGSHKNLSRPLNELNIIKGIIMAGYDNQYGHPSGIILRKFKDSKIRVKVLTEYDKNYIKCYKFPFYFR